ncbi:hypothetical protein BC831DRAFT_444961, partial [Entophlyctis helioformis]
MSSIDFWRWVFVTLARWMSGLTMGGDARMDATSFVFAPALATVPAAEPTEKQRRQPTSKMAVADWLAQRGEEQLKMIQSIQPMQPMQPIQVY